MFFWPTVRVSIRASLLSRRVSRCPFLEGIEASRRNEFLCRASLELLPLSLRHSAAGIFGYGALPCAFPPMAVFHRRGCGRAEAVHRAAQETVQPLLLNGSAHTASHCGRLGRGKRGVSMFACGSSAYGVQAMHTRGASKGIPADTALSFAAVLVFFPRVIFTSALYFFL